jgi:hypothetical protein
MRDTIGLEKPEVWSCNENKDLAFNPAGTKVTSGFGPASAIIKFDCVIAMTSMKSTKVQKEGKNRDAETTEGFLTD